ncbi:hypothetical protein FLAN108750_09505 [Flavobacterium antarcticum]
MGHGFNHCDKKKFRIKIDLFRNFTRIAQISTNQYLDLFIKIAQHGPWF